MVAIHDIPMDQYGNGMAVGAVALSLLERSQCDRLHRYQQDGWEVEIRRGRNYVVTRTNTPLAGNALIDAAINKINRALDLTSVEDGDHLITKFPAVDNIVFERTGQSRIVRFSGVTDFKIHVPPATLTVSVDGIVQPPPIKPILNWTPAFRFYRLSQSNGDLFDSYRNLFLALEALLDQLFSKKNSEGENTWLIRAIELARSPESNLANPAHDVVNQIYAIRVRLFHAKKAQSYLSKDQVSYMHVAKSYSRLLALWTEIARDRLAIGPGGGGLTHFGYKMLIEGGFALARFAVTADDTPPNKADPAPSPRGLPVLVFAEPLRIREMTSGRMGLYGRIDVSEIPVGESIGRILTLSSAGDLLTTSSISGGLLLEGADVFEVSEVFHLESFRV